jgi:hypothetical protein
MTHNEMIRVLEAHRDGKPIEARQLDHSTRGRHWMPVSADPTCRWMFDHFEYRIKPEPPKPREWWIHFISNDSADIQSDRSHCDKCIHVREVIE